MSQRKVGPYIATGLLGQGGMADVWRCHVPGVERELALKVLKRTDDTSDKTAALLSEVASIARFDHRGVVRIYDYGLTDGGGFDDGLPWLVMELANQGPLTRWLKGRRVDWPLVRGVLLMLCDALAHVHARGVVHRDLKPANVLVSDDGTGPRMVLTDFGIAQTVGQQSVIGEEDTSTAGTLRYMAPEQLVGAWRDFGPWTDLYGLGGIAWNLTHGKPPLRVSQGHHLAHQKLAGEQDLWEPRLPVADGLESWVRCLLSANLADRFPSAAEAARALMELGAVGHGVPEDVPTQIDESVTMLQTLIVVRAGVDGESVHAAGQGLLAGRPPPEDWGRPLPPRRDHIAAGSGNLLAMRTLPMIGRTWERSQLWSRLHQVWEAPEPRVVLLEGPAGVGKTRLAEWIGHRASEVGSALVLRARERADAEEPGMTTALRSFFGTDGQTIEQARVRVADLLTRWKTGCEDDAAILADIAVGVAATKAGPRHAAMLRLVQGLGRNNAVVLICDDLHLGSDMLSFLRFALSWRGSRPTPLLVVGTVATEALAAEGSQAEALNQLVAQSSDSVTRLTLGPLGQASRRRFYEVLLGLDPKLARMADDRTEGNPGFALAMVGDWVARGLLQPGRGGLVLKDAKIPLPESIASSWDGWLDEVLGRLDDRGRAAVEVAAVLGSSVSRSEWEQVLGEAPGRKMVAWLTRTGLLGGDGTDLAFPNAQVRQCLLDRAERGGRLAALHGRCAAQLSEISPARRGRHLVGSGALAQALEPLLTGARERYDAGDIDGAIAILGTAEAAMIEIGLPGFDVRWGRMWLLRAELDIEQGRMGQAREALDQIEGHILSNGWSSLEVRHAMMSADLVQYQGRLAEAAIAYERALAIAAGHPPTLAVAKMLARLAFCQGNTGRTLDARKSFRLAADTFAQFGRIGGQVHCLLSLGWSSEEPQRSECLAQAQALLPQVDTALERAGCLALLADMLSATGKLDEAAAYLETSATLLDELGSTQLFNVVAIQGRVEVDRGRYRKAEALIEHALDIGRGAHADPSAIALIDLCAAAVAAEHRDTVKLRFHLDQIPRSLTDMRVSARLDWLAGRIGSDPTLHEAVVAVRRLRAGMP